MVPYMYDMIFQDSFGRGQLRVLINNRVSIPVTISRVSRKGEIHFYRRLGRTYKQEMYMEHSTRFPSLGKLGFWTGWD